MSNLRNLLSTGVTAKTQNFTASGTFTVPENVFTIIVNMVGAGGGASHLSGNRTARTIWGGGGGGGYYQEYPLAVTPGDVLTITVGAGGTSATLQNSGSSYVGTLTAGGNTSIYKGASPLLIAYGGSDAAPFLSTSYSPADVNQPHYGGGCGGAPNGSGGGGKCHPGTGDTIYSAAAGGDCGSRTSGSFSGGSTIRYYDFFGEIFGYGEYANGSTYGGSTPFPAGHGASSSSSNTPGENGLVVLTWFE